MRTIALMLLAGGGMVAMAMADESAGFDHTHAGWAVVLASTVNAEGQVDYAALKNDPKPLHAYLQGLARIYEETYRSWTKDQQLAYLINLYNAQTIDLITRHYPLGSIKDIGSLFRGPWGQPVVSLFGRITTLDNLEHKIIRAMFAEPRTHFVLVCAARSAPPLRAEPYTADRLNEQLDDQARRFLSDPARNRIDPESAAMHLSPVFKWFAADFEAVAGSVEAYVMKFISEADAEKMLGRVIAVRYLDYDWSLNDGPGAK